ncbi:MAG TPA: hypothetical protein VK283_15025 [Acidimicrobiales bacterium]|nr:hypothetical protein [Acidimicrobiales bacterium]
MVGLPQFAEGLTGAKARRLPRGRVKARVLSALPVVVLVIWVVARLARHL